MNRAQLLKLNAKADSLIQLDWRTSLMKGLTGPIGKTALKWGGIGAGVGAVGGGVSGALSDDPNQTAIGGALKGAAAGGTLGAGAGALKGSGIMKGLFSKSSKPLPIDGPVTGDPLWRKAPSVVGDNTQLGAMQARDPLGIYRRKQPVQYSSRLDQLIQLSAKADQLINFAYDDEEKEGHFLRNTAIAGGVGTAGLYGLGRSVAGPVQPGLRGIGQTISKGAGAVGSSVGNFAGGIKDTFMKGYSREGGGILRGIRGVARGLTKGRSRFVGLSSRHARLVQLSEKLDEVIQFAEEENHWLARSTLGTPVTAAWHARKGQKLKAFGHELGHGYYEAGKGAIGGAAAGTGVGTIVSALSKGKIGLKKGSLIGAGVGGYAGALGGTIKGNFDKRSTEIMRKYQ